MEKEIISTPDAPRSVGPYSQATRAGDLIFVAGQGGFHLKTGLLVDGGIREQTARLLRTLARYSRLPEVISAA